MALKIILRDLWSKLLISILVVGGTLIVIGALYYKNSSCGTAIFDCLELEVMVLGGGLLIFSLPLVAILLFWEILKKIRQKKHEKEMAQMRSADIPEMPLSAPAVKIGSVTEKKPENPPPFEEEEEAFKDKITEELINLMGKK